MTEVSKQEITNGIREIFLKIVKEYHEQFNTNKFYNIEEMDTFLKSYKLPGLKQEEIESGRN